VWSARLVAGVAMCALALAGVLVGGRLLQRPAAVPGPAIAQGPGDLVGRIRGATPGSLATSLQRPLMDEAQALWVETRQVMQVVADRLPSPPTRPR
jgi:hypothetical protein